MPLLHISRTPGPLPPRMHPLHIHASPMFRRVERITREGMGRVGTPPGVFWTKNVGQAKKRWNSSDLGIKILGILEIMEKQTKKEWLEVGNYSSKRNHPGKREFWGEADETNKLVYKGAKFKIYQQNNDQTWYNYKHDQTLDHASTYTYRYIPN